MAGQTANVASIEVLRTIRLALQQFQVEAENALTQLEIEGRRPVAWIDSDRTLYWPSEVRKASDRLSEARIALQRAEATTSAEESKYAYDERKALEKTKHRLRLCEEKVQAVQKWRVVIHKETDEFRVQVSKLRRYLESDFAKAIAHLGRMAEALIGTSSSRRKAPLRRAPHENLRPGDRRGAAYPVAVRLEGPLDGSQRPMERCGSPAVREAASGRVAVSLAAGDRRGPAVGRRNRKSRSRVRRS